MSYEGEEALWPACPAFNKVASCLSKNRISLLGQAGEKVRWRARLPYVFRRLTPMTDAIIFAYYQLNGR
jgi:hypothetical protein